MAPRGSNKQRSLDQENEVARWYGGQRSPSSGAADTDAGDVRTASSLIECKTSGGPGYEPDKQPAAPSLNQIIKWLEDARDDAWEEGREPVLAIRRYAPESRLSNNAGWVDLAIRPLIEDALRDRFFRNDT